MLSILATTNPGLFESDTSIVTLPSIVLFAICIFGLVTVIAISSLAPSFTDPGWGLRIGTLLILAVSVTSGIVGSIIYNSNIVEFRAENAAYSDSVTAWLKSDFRITSDADTSFRLAVNGESFVVDYEGRQVSVSVTETIDGELALVDDQKTVLEPFVAGD